MKKYSSRLLATLRESLMARALLTLSLLWIGLSALMFQIERQSPEANIHSLGDSLWWGLVTLLTVGYGDRYPVTPSGRWVAGLLMMSGVVVIGILTARISSYFLEQVLKKEKGLVKTESLNHHFLVCGYKDEMDHLLIQILDFNRDLEPHQLLILGQFDDSFVQLLRAHPRLKEIQVIQGDYSQELALKRAAPERARKILILADKSLHANGQIPSAKETDSKTLMTAMLLSHIARGVPVSAEILDPSMDTYLRMAQVHEIIYSREYNRLLLANASVGAGIANVLFDLLSPKTPTVLTTLPLSEHLIGLSYEALKERLEKEIPQTIVIGILENTGNNHVAKERALRKAQKTADMGHLVRNLKAVKEMRFNSPLFNPPQNYVVPEGAAAILIQTRSSGETQHAPAEV